MSTNGARRSAHNGHPTHNGHGQSAHREVAAFFTSIAAAGEQPRLHTVTGVCQFDIAGAGTWRVTINDGVPTITEGAQHARRADCTVACDARDFLRIIGREGRLNLYAAVLQGLVTISGDLAFAFTVLGGVTIRRPVSDNALPR